MPREVRRTTLDGLKALNELNYRQLGDPQTHTRIQQYELAFRMQASVPELTDLASEPAVDVTRCTARRRKKPGTFANTALLARRMVERGVRFVQIYHNNWDTHANVAGRLPDQCRDVDQPCFGLIQDLKQRGLLDETLVIWGGEFGRTIYSQGGLSDAELRPRPPSAVLHDVDGRRRRARRATIYGETDDFSYNIVEGPGASARSARDGAAPARVRPRAVHVQAPGAGPEADRACCRRVLCRSCWLRCGRAVGATFDLVRPAISVCNAAGL